MALVETLMTSVAIPVGKFLLKSYLGAPADDIGGGILEIAKRNLKNYSDQREANRKFERLGEQIVSRVLPLFGLS